MRRSTCVVLLACVGALACFDDPEAPAAPTSTETSGDGDGDGDVSTGDGDGEPATGDGDGDPATGDGDGDGDVCEGLEGCPCENTSECTEGLECVEGECVSEWCGNGINEPGEDCDDANEIDGDGCDNDCTDTELLAVEAGGAHTCLLIEGGRVRCWGWNSMGQLGVGNTEAIGDDESALFAEDVPLPGPVRQLSVGDQHTCVVLDDDSVRCWGLGENGRLGLGNEDNVGDDEFPTEPIEVGGQVEQVAASAFHSCARLDNGAVRCWGLGSLGRLGYANTATIGDDEVPADAGSVDIGGALVSIHSGGASSCGISIVGGIRCWGRNEQGQLGYGNLDNIGDDETPASVGDVSVVPMGLALNTKVSEVAHGVTHTCALFETGDVSCWGSNVFGELGQANTTFVGDDEFPSTLSPIELPGPAIALSAGGAHTCAAIEGGELYCWGANTFGQLGYGNTGTVGDDESPSEAGPVSTSAFTVDVDAGFFHTCAILHTNELRCWGNNDTGQLGLGNTDKIGDDEEPSDAPIVPIF